MFDNHFAFNSHTSPLDGKTYYTVIHRKSQLVLAKYITRDEVIRLVTTFHSNNLFNPYH